MATEITSAINELDSHYRELMKKQVDFASSTPDRSNDVANIFFTRWEFKHENTTILYHKSMQECKGWIGQDVREIHPVRHDAEQPLE